MKWSHLILLLLCGAVALPAQENEARFRAGFSVKAVIGIGYLKSGFGDLSVSGFLTKEIGDHLLVGHQISASLYSRGLGTSIFDDQNRRAQIDLVNSSWRPGRAATIPTSSTGRSCSTNAALARSCIPSSMGHTSAPISW